MAGSRTRSNGMRLMLAGLAAVAALVTAPRAEAFVAITGGPDMPDSVTVGQTNQPGSLSISVFLTSAPDNAVTLTSIVLEPSCGSDAGPCQAPNLDPGVFAIDSPATGRAGSACEGVSFTAAIADAATGSYSFTPSAPVILSGAQQCDIEFTFDVVKMPTKDYLPDPGVQTYAHSVVQGQSVGEGTGIGGDGPIAVSQAATVLGLGALSPVDLGDPVRATATLLGTSNPTGDVAFSLYGPNDPTCSGPAVFGALVPVTGAAATSPAFLPAATGSYRWTATYGGDANNLDAASGCNAPGSISQVVTPPAPTGKRAAALKKCKKIKKKKKRRKCLRKARKLPA